MSKEIKMNDPKANYRFGNTDLHEAVLEGRLEDIKKFRKADFRKQNEKGETPLHLACQSDRVLYDIVEHIVSIHRAGIESLDFRKNTPLHLACKSKNIDKVKVLYNYDANLEARNEDNETPLLVACEEGSSEIVKYLLQKGANPNVQNKHKNGIHQIAKIQGDANMLEAVKTSKNEGTLKMLLKSLSRDNEKLEITKRELREKQSLINVLENRSFTFSQQIVSLKSEVDSLMKEVSLLTAGREQELNAINQQLLDREAKITEFVSNRSSDADEIRRLKSDVESLNKDVESLNDDVKSLTSEISSLTIENERLKAEKQISESHNYVIALTSLACLTREEQTYTCNILITELKRLYTECQFQVEYSSSDSKCISTLKVSSLTALSDVVKAAMHNIDKDIQRGLQWKLSRANINFAESAIILPAKISRPFLCFLAKGELTVRLPMLVIRAYKADIALEHVDVVVASTGDCLSNFVGAAQSIAQKAGSAKVKTFCQNAMGERRSQPLKVGDVVHIDGGHNLPARFIVYTVGPANRIDTQVGDLRYELLYKTFWNVLNYAHQTLKAKSIAIPAISAGIVILACIIIFYSTNVLICIFCNINNLTMSCTFINIILTSIVCNIITFKYVHRIPPLWNFLSYK